MADETTVGGELAPSPPEPPLTDPFGLDADTMLTLIDAEMEYRSLHEFVKNAWHLVSPFVPFVDNWHVGLIVEHLQAMTRGEIKKLIINVPPRHSKSLIVSVFWFCWVWMRDPSSQWVYASYDSALVNRDSVRCRDIVKSRWYRERHDIKWTVKADADQKDYFRNTYQGSRMSTTPEGRASGFDADYLVADDPSNVREAHSARKLDQVFEWWTQSMSTRGNDPEQLRRAVVMQRIAERDLTGRLIADKYGYEQLCIPARHEPKRHFEGWDLAEAANETAPIVPTSLQLRRPELRDPRTEEGDPLWPKRFNSARLDELAKELGPMAAAGQLQQRPTSEKGTIFDRATFNDFTLGVRNGKRSAILRTKAGVERFFTLERVRLFQTVDTAMTESAQSDYTVVLTFGITSDADLLIFDVFRAKLEVPVQYACIRKMLDGSHRWDAESRQMIRLGTWHSPIRFQAVEKKSSGIGLIQQAARDGRPFKILNADGGKRERAIPLSTALHNGKVFFLAGAGWRVDFDNELVAFDRGRNDDQADAASYAAFLLLHDEIIRSAIEGPLAMEDEEDEAAKAAAGRVTVSYRGTPLQVEFDDD